MDGVDHQADGIEQRDRRVMRIVFFLATTSSIASGEPRTNAAAMAEHSPSPRTSALHRGEGRELGRIGE